MAYIKLSDFIFDCDRCHTPCDGVSKGTYIFKNDVSLSESFEEMLIKRINTAGKYSAAKTQKEGYPDIEIQNPDRSIYSYLEVKVQQRTFMQVKKYLPHSNLEPSETIALNLSDLLRYFTIQQTTGTSTVIVWFLLNRLCIVDKASFKVYFQSCEELERIYHLEKQKRTFKRKSGEGDVVDGVHKGVTVNFHFSLTELKEWKW
ncbi:hypothetical protein [Segetibacter koreensis]|uniref:hypothetical protein n=1 Tax=Segetibacter koreensis TaxID=398037 RepID=UPI00035F1D32|nr:hypothetical protein [Segetibacter koreensis]